MVLLEEKRENGRYVTDRLVLGEDSLPVMQVHCRDPESPLWEGIHFPYVLSGSEDESDWETVSDDESDWSESDDECSDDYGDDWYAYHRWVRRPGDPVHWDE